MQSPFTSLFEPEGGSSEGSFNPFALIGRISGIPTTSERQGALVGQGLSELAKLQESGLTPQQAYNKFLQTDLGRNIFTSSGDAFNKITEQYIKNVTPPTPTAVTTSPGAQTNLIGPGGKVQGTFTQPTAETQNFQAGVPSMSTAAPGHAVFNRGQPVGQVPTTEQQNINVPKYGSMAPGNVPFNEKTGEVNRSQANPTQEQQNFDFYSRGMTPQAIQELKAIWAVPVDQRPAAQERAVQRLVQSGAITPSIGDKIIAGTLEIRPAKNSLGDDVGSMIIDKSAAGEGTATLFPNNISTQGTPTGTQPQTNINAPVQPGAPVDGRGAPVQGTGLGNMFSVFGAGPAMAQTASSLAQNISSGNVTEKSRERAVNHARVQRLREAALGIAKEGGSLGIPKSIVDQTLTMFQDPGFLSSPETVVIPQMMTYQQGLKQAIAEDEAIIRSAGRPNSVVSVKEAKEASGRRIMYGRILSRMPSEQEMTQRMDALSSGKADTGVISNIPETVTESVKATFGAAPAAIGAVTGSTSNAPVQAPRSAPRQQAPQQPQQAPQGQGPSQQDLTTLQQIPRMNEAQVIQMYQNPNISPVVRNALRTRAQEIAKAKGRK